VRKKSVNVGESVEAIRRSRALTSASVAAVVNCSEDRPDDGFPSSQGAWREHRGWGLADATRLVLSNGPNDTLEYCERAWGSGPTNRPIPLSPSSRPACTSTHEDARYLAVGSPSPKSKSEIGEHRAQAKRHLLRSPGWCFDAPSLLALKRRSRMPKATKRIPRAWLVGSTLPGRFEALIARIARTVRGDDTWAIRRLPGRTVGHFPAVPRRNPSG
jgi:hypothetical protein